jgi:hypothetical protein
MRSRKHNPVAYYGASNIQVPMTALGQTQTNKGTAKKVRT